MSVALLGFNVIYQLLQSAQVHCGRVDDDAIPKINLGNFKSGPPALLIPKLHLLTPTLLEQTTS